ALGASIVQDPADAVDAPRVAGPKRGHELATRERSDLARAGQEVQHLQKRRQPAQTLQPVHPLHSPRGGLLGFAGEAQAPGGSIRRRQRHDAPPPVDTFSIRAFMIRMYQVIGVLPWECDNKVSEMDHRGVAGRGPGRHTEAVRKETSMTVAITAAKVDLDSPY